MSIASEITRLQGVKADILQAISRKGVTVPVGSALDDCPDLIASISGGGDTVKIGERIYNTVVIDGVRWLSENLQFCPNGVELGATGAPSTPAAWYYDNDEELYSLDGVRKCGLLYNWYAVKFLNDNKDVFFKGWHVPTLSEWENLINDSGAQAAGSHLKASNLSWAPNWQGLDTYGFRVMPGGGYSHYTDGSFNDVCDYATMWTITDSDNEANYIYMKDDKGYVNNLFRTKTRGCSLRLVKDA